MSALSGPLVRNVTSAASFRTGKVKVMRWVLNCYELRAASVEQPSYCCPEASSSWLRSFFALMGLALFLTIPTAHAVGL